MTVFAILATLLALVVAGLLAWPLRRHSRGLSLGVVIVVPLLALALYRLVGTPAALDAANVRAPATMQDAIALLENELRANPDQAQGWQLLGRAYAGESRFAEARTAFSRAAALLPDDSDAQVDYAESRAKADPAHAFDAEAVASLTRVLKRDPKHQRARWFLGIAQRQAGDNAAAAATWEPLLAQVDARTADALRPQLDAARADAGLPPLPPVDPSPAASAKTIQVTVSLDPDFAARVRLSGDASVFVIARIPNGPPMPVAVEKHALQDLPLTVTLDDADSPMPTQALSSLGEVELVARISTSGNAMRQDGDVESAPVRIALPATAPVELVIGAKQ